MHQAVLYTQLIHHVRDERHTNWVGISQATGPRQRRILRPAGRGPPGARQDLVPDDNFAAIVAAYRRTGFACAWYLNDKRTSPKPRACRSSGA